ncbi:MAG: cupin protein [Ferruginibacter sp.]|nr:cupin protein [Ferruginibacter sp.]
MQITTKEALNSLQNSGGLFLEVFRHGTLSAEIYAPKEKDNQQAHDKDEVYIVIAGTGNFYLDGKYFPFQAGDFLFVPAGAEHRFEDFTPDFSTWVIFYGPPNGEEVAAE